MSIERTAPLSTLEGRVIDIKSSGLWRKVARDIINTELFVLS